MLLTTKAVLVSLQAGVNHNTQRVLLQGQLPVIIGMAGGQVFELKNVYGRIEGQVDGGIKLIRIGF